METYRILLFFCAAATGYTTLCPRQIDQVEEGRRCRKECKTDDDCRGRKSCYCDGVCGMSCFNKERDCGEPDVIHYGYVVWDKTSWNGTAQYSCNEGYGLKGGSLRICHSDRKWSGSPPKCEQFAKCGQAGDVGNIKEQATSLARVIGGEDAADTTWPWQALITRKGWNLAETFHKKATLGGGSLLNNNWVLTAAHVFMEESPNDGWEAMIVVSLGIFQRPIDGEMTESHRMFLVGEYFQHNGFNPWTFENDIALIKLGSELDSDMDVINRKNSVAYDFHIRPVCLPCTGKCLKKDQLKDERGNSLINNRMTEQEICQREEELLLAKDAKVVLTGFGHLDRMLKDERHTQFHLPRQLQQGLLQIQDSETCSENMEEMKANYPDDGKIQNLTFSDNFICCRSGKNDSTVDACKGDSGGPVVREVVDINTNESCWIQIGIVSFGLGCGGPSYPGFYTNVVNYVDWINRAMSDNTAVAADKRTNTCHLQSLIEPEGWEVEASARTEFNIDETVELSCTGQMVSVTRDTGTFAKPIFVCQSGGIWTRAEPGTDFKCVRLGCPPDPESPPNSRWHAARHGGNPAVGDRMYFSCKLGFSSLEESKYLVCQEDGTWSDNAGCEEWKATLTTSYDNIEYLVYLDEAHQSSYTDAQQFCLSIGANLAVIYSDAVRRALLDAFQQNQLLRKHVYIGLTKPSWRPWRWDTTGVASLGIGHWLVTPNMCCYVVERRCATASLRCWYDSRYHQQRCWLDFNNVDCETTRPFLCQRRK